MCLEGRPIGPGGVSPYTRDVRRWVCLIALLAGFAGEDYTRGARLRRPVPIERRLRDVSQGTGPRLPLEAWWSRP